MCVGVYAGNIALVAALFFACIFPISMQEEIFESDHPALIILLIVTSSTTFASIVLISVRNMSAAQLCSSQHINTFIKLASKALLLPMRMLVIGAVLMIAGFTLYAAAGIGWLKALMVTAIAVVTAFTPFAYAVSLSVKALYAANLCAGKTEQWGDVAMAHMRVPASSGRVASAWSSTGKGTGNQAHAIALF